MTVAAFDARIALRANPFLATFNTAGVLSSADVHVAQRLGHLGGEGDERVLLAVALAVRAVRAGSVCVTLDDVADLAAPEADDGAPTPDLPWPDVAEWEAACRASPLVDPTPPPTPHPSRDHALLPRAKRPVVRPLRWVGGRLYLDRYWRHEELIRTELGARLGAAPFAVGAATLTAALARADKPPSTPAQLLAAAVAAVSRVTVLTGGPGTGKTTTVARILAVLASLQPGPAPRIALAAPTGKAATRLQEAVREQVEKMPEQDKARLGTLSASTVHRVLGWQPGSSTRFRHNRSNRLPHDIVVVDETSMMSLTLMSRLLEALRPDARLVLVGDPDQLASVEAGAVLGDLVARPVVGPAVEQAVRRLVPDLAPAGTAGEALGNGVVRLERVHRYGLVIGRLAEAIRAGDGDTAIQILRSRQPEVEFHEAPDGGAPPVEDVRRDAVEAGTRLVKAARDGDVDAALAVLERHRLLVAHRRGPAGVRHWSALVEVWLAEAGYGPDGEHEWYAGRPLLVTANDRDTGLSNGDTGVVVADGRGGLVAVFGTPQSPVRVPPHRLSSVQTVHAMTVHRGQGSQFTHVSLVLPRSDSPLLTRELLYTAVTRARELVRVIGSEAAVRAAVSRPIRRASGLRSEVGTRNPTAT